MSVKPAMQGKGWAVVLLIGLGGASLLAQHAPTNTNAPPPPSAEYKLMPRDKIVFRIDEDPVINGRAEPLEVSSEGEVQIPVSRGYQATILVQAQGRTLKELGAEIKTKLEKGYYRQATIHMQLVAQNQRAGRVLVYGAIRGTIILRPGEQKHLSTAILELGYDGFADLKRVKLHRIDPVTKASKTIIVNVKEILSTNDRSKDILLQDEDRVEVPEKGLVF